jgi:hypothetical protein
MVEDLYERKLLSVCVCTETLAAGINLPARSVVLTALMKGPLGKKKLVDASSAHQIFGRAGRPQFDDRGFVFCMSHEDDVKILRWQEKYDSIPEDTKDPGLIKAKKQLKKKKPTRRENQQYWSEAQFTKLIEAPPTKLYSKGPLPWRLLAYLLKKSPNVSLVRTFLKQRFYDESRSEAADRKLDDMLLTLYQGGFIELGPIPPQHETGAVEQETTQESTEPEQPASTGLFSKLLEEAQPKKSGSAQQAEAPPPKPRYHAESATPTEQLEQMLVFRSVHPVYATFLLEHLGIADRDERLQILESLLEIPRSIFRHVRVPFPEDLPPGPLATTRVDPELISKGLLVAPVDEEEEEDEFERKPPPPALGEKMLMLFETQYPVLNSGETRFLPV